MIQTPFLGNPLLQWLIAGGIALLVWLALALARRLIEGRLSALAGRTTTLWDDLVISALSRTRQFFLFLVSVVAGSTVLALPDSAGRVLTRLAVLALLLQGGLWASTAFRTWLQVRLDREAAKDRAAATTLGALGIAAQFVIWAVVVMLALDNLGVDITALVAGLGIGGVAVALAVQNILGDLFASLSILLDKPFVVGDFVIVGEQLGTVEHIGLKTTRIRSLWGEQVVVSNGDLLQSRLRNMGRMAERRVVFEVGVTYQTPRDKLERIPGMLRAAVEEQARTRFDRSHFKAYGDFALTFETVYHVLSPEYNVYMDIQQAVNLGIHARFEAEGVEFAYPTQTLFLQRTG